MKAHITTKCKPCPFCGARADEIESITGMDLIACSNYNGCGAIVSFNNKDCDERGVSPVVYFNRRAGQEDKKMDEKEKSMLFDSVGKLENSLKKLAESAKEKSADIRSFAKVLRETENLPTIDPETLRPVSEWELNPDRWTCE